MALAVDVGDTLVWLHGGTTPVASWDKKLQRAALRETTGLPSTVSCSWLLPEHLRAAWQEERLADAVMAQVAADMRGALDADRGSMPYVDLRADAGPREGQVDPS